MGQGPYVLEHEAAGLRIIPLSSREAIVRPDRDVSLLKKQSCRCGGHHHRSDNLIVSEKALTSQGSRSQERPSTQTVNNLALSQVSKSHHKERTPFFWRSNYFLRSARQRTTAVLCIEEFTGNRLHQKSVQNERVDVVGTAEKQISRRVAPTTP
jgi:hypothetical protein